MTIWFVTPRVVETFNIFHGDAKIQNVKFRTKRLREIQVQLDNGEVEKARELIGLLYKVDIHNLEIMQEGESYPKQINLRAKKVLAEIESGSENPILKTVH